jgi:hypothetical protein
MSNNPNQSLLTYGANLVEAEQIYYSPVAQISSTDTPIATSYCFLSSVTPWSGNTVPVPTQDQYSLKQIFKNIFVAKQITTDSISPVIQRIDWTANTVYQYYNDTVDMFALDQNGFLINSFYVKNRYDQVFKCLWNGANTASANGVVSTNEPYFQPGQYNTDNIFFGTDGYKWKYMYTIDAGAKIKFMDTNWIPVPIGTNIPNTETVLGFGDIEVINVTNGGSGYDPTNSAITITVTGDGTGATAQVGTVTGGVIQDITVLNPGYGYTYSNVSITSAAGSGAVTISPSSPIGGHGYNPISELGCFNVMLTCQFAGNEAVNGIAMVPTTDGNGSPIEYYQMGILINPTSISSYPAPAANSIYKTTTDIVVAASTDTGFVSGETIYQGATLSSSTFTATVVNFDLANNVGHLINTTGTPITNQVLHGNTSGSARTLLTYNTPDFNIGSGYIAYIENLTGIQRSPDGIEQFKVVLSY